MKYIDNTTENGTNFIKLIGCDGIKYGDFVSNSTAYKNQLESRAGVYHFFSISDDCGRATSLYIGQAMVTESGWDLYKRLIQHKQIDHNSGVHTNIANEFSIPREDVINFLSKGNVYFQYVELFYLSTNSEIPTDLKTKVTDFEKYCKDRLKPRYTIL